MGTVPMQHFHNGGLAAGGKGLALLDLLPGLDVNVAQPVEDRAHARAVVDDQRSSVVAARSSARSILPLAGAMTSSPRVVDKITFVLVRPACAGVGAALAVAAATYSVAPKVSVVLRRLRNGCTNPASAQLMRWALR